MKQNRLIQSLLFSLFIFSVFFHQVYANLSINHIFHTPLQTRSFFYNEGSHTSGSFFFSHAKKGYDFNEKKVSLLNLDGEYNLKTLTRALDIYNADLGTAGYQNPLLKESPDYIERNAIYDTRITVQSYGINLAHEQQLFKEYLFAGLTLPIIHVRSHNRITFSSKQSDSYFVNIFNNDQDAWHKIELARKAIHQELGLRGNLWSQTGIGDIEFHLGLHKTWEHVLLCKSIQLSWRLGGIAPTGIQRSDDYIPSVAYGSNGHWSIYSALGAHISLKQNLSTGIYGTINIPLSRIKKDQRIAVYEEPSYMSPLKKDLCIKPGVLWSVSPFITFENLLQGGHFHIKYTYLHHAKDTIREANTDGIVSSYLTRTDGPWVNTDGILQVKRQKKQNKWHDHYMTFQCMYDPHLALKKWWLTPHFYALYNYPLGGRGAAQNHHFECGIVIHF